MAFHGLLFGGPYLASAAVTDQDELECGSSAVGQVGVVCTRRARVWIVRCFVGFGGVSGWVATLRFSVAREVLWLCLTWMGKLDEGTKMLALGAPATRCQPFRACSLALLHTHPHQILAPPLALHV